MPQSWLKKILSFWKLVVAVAAFMVLIVWTSGVLTEQVPPGRVEAEPGIPLPVDAATYTVQSQPIPVRVEVVGTMVSDNTAHISARIGAHVREVLVAAGDAVTNGQVVVRLDDRDQRAQLDAAHAALHQARTEYNRIRQLFNAQATTEQQLIAADSARRIAESQLNQAEVALTYTEILAPMDGLVTDRQVESGMLANPGQILLTIYDPSHMRLDAPVPVRLVDYLAIGDVLPVTLERPATTIKGRVHRIVSEIDPRTRTQTVHILLDAPPFPILPGTFGRVAIPTEARDLLMIPSTALFQVGQLHMVRAVEQQRVVRRLVTTGLSQDGFSEILSGLNNGDVILLPEPQP